MLSGVEGFFGKRGRSKEKEVRSQTMVSMKPMVTKLGLENLKESQRESEGNFFLEIVSNAVMQ